MSPEEPAKETSSAGG